MNRDNISEEINAAIKLPDDDDHALFCAVANLPEDEDEPEFALASEPGDEPSWNEALTGPDREKWLAARDVEIKMLDSLNTFDVVYKPAGANLVNTHFVCKKKRDTQGDIDKFKVRFVAGGHMQIYGVDYE